MRNVLTFLLLTIAFLSINSCFTPRNACAREEMLIERLMALRDTLSSQTEVFKVQIAAKEKTISAQNTIIASVEAGQQCLDSYQSQYYNLASSHFQLENKVKKLTEELKTSEKNNQELLNALNGD